MPGQAASPLIVDRPDGVQLTVRVTPRSRRNEIGGIVDLGGGRCGLAIHLAAPPVDGAANELLCTLLAAQLGVGRRSLTLISGEKSRIKTLRVAGDARKITAALNALIPTDQQ
jgi:uncharacterized protein (TIGR00251 family)